MFKTFILIAYRNFLKNKFFVIMNILGLGITIACCTVAYLNYKFEADFNNIFNKREKIYKINTLININDREQRYGITPLSLFPSINQRLAGVEHVTRFTTQHISVRKENKSNSKVFSQKIAFVDSTFFNVFSYPVLWGNTNSLNNNNIILTSEASERFFGKENSIGESLTLYTPTGEIYEVKIIAVLKNPPENTIIDFQAILNFNNYLSFNKEEEMNWKSWIGATFLIIPNPINTTSIEKYLDNFVELINKNKLGSKISRFEVVSLHDFTKMTQNIWGNWLGYNLHPAQIIGPIIMSILIWLLACSNYINTSISIANTRLKEIGVRKVLGSSRSKLVTQFLGENSIICLVALLISLFFTYFLINEYNKMWYFMDLNFNLKNNYILWLFLLFLIIITSFFAGFYSAFYLSSFNAVSIFKNTYKLRRGGWLSKLLLSFQIIVMSLTIITSIIFIKNSHYQKSIKAGYDIENIIVIPLDKNIDSKVLKDTYENIPDVESIAFSDSHIGGGWGASSGILSFQGKTIEVDVFRVGTDYHKTMGLKLIEGRGFDMEFESSDIRSSIIIDKIVIEQLRLNEPIGQILRLDTLPVKVIGIVNSFHNGFNGKPMPNLFWRNSITPQNLLIVRVYNQTKKKMVIQQLKKEWEKQIKNTPFDCYEQSSFDAESRSINKNIILINVFFSIIATILSIVALYSLISLNINRKIKEIGIRSVFGATIYNINFLISKPFLKIIIFSSFFGGICGYYFANTLLSILWSSYIKIDLPSVIMPTILIAIITSLVLYAKINNTIRKNPIESLKYE